MLQRALAALLLAAALAAAAVEHSSPLAARIRAGKPWLFWLAVKGVTKTPAIHIGVYNPIRRSLVLIRLPEQTRLDGKLTLSRAYRDALRSGNDAATATRAVEDLAQGFLSALTLEPIAWEGVGRLTIELGESGEDDEPAVAAARALKARGDSPRAWAALAVDTARGLFRGDKTAADPFLLSIKLRRVTLEHLEPALLPDAAFAPAFLARTFAPAGAPTSAPDNSRAVIVEVLNGAHRQGLAAQAAKMLRSRNVDVTALGTTEHSHARTVVYDRTGDFAHAARVRAVLGCPTAIAATRIDALRGVDVSLVLGSDCADSVARAGKDF